ncbi:MAG: class I SAM-dependent methyltransferase [Terriglobales bacterium]
MLGRAFHYSQREFRKWRLARQLARESGYSFTSDYVSQNESHWTLLLKEYRGRPEVRLLEIGSYEGRSAIWFLDNILTHPTASIVCVDFFTAWRLDMRFDHNIRLSGRSGQVTKLKGHSDAILCTLPLDHFDIIYIDGSHQAADVLMDAVLAWHRTKPGGIIIFDDYLWAPGTPPADRPQMAIDFFLELFQGRYQLLWKQYQVAIRKPALALPPQQ